MLRRAALGALTTLGCGAPDAPTTPDATPPTDAQGTTSVELGTGQTDWLALPPSGGRVELIHGPQGGYHVFGRVRFRGLAPDVFVSFRVTPASGGEPLNVDESLRRQERRGLVRVGDFYESSSAELVILTRVNAAADAANRPFVFHATVRDATTGRTLAATREVTIVDDDP